MSKHSLMMKSDKSGMSRRLAVGLISGTSLDGVDAALVQISGTPERAKVKLLAFVTVKYPRNLRDKLLRVAGGSTTTAAEISELNFSAGEVFGRAALRLCQRAGVRAERLSAIGSHGQTIFHQGSSTRTSPASTLQIGEPALIAYLTGAPVVADFRTADMAAGGQGAPLVPLVDYLLLGGDGVDTVALNIGGIANVTVIPAGACPEQIFGFDTGPGNMIMDALVRHFYEGRKQYDAGGRLAARGQVIEAILSRCRSLPFFRKRPPKSAGREQFGSDFVRQYFLAAKPPPEDLLRTAAELTASTIADAVHRFAYPRFMARGELRRLVISGGGARNLFLLKRIQSLLPALPVHRSDEFGLPADGKEAIAFAVLADRTIHGLSGNLPSVTGAGAPVVLGKVVRL